MEKKIVDLLVIGGGVNGCGVAADAAGRGLSVLLCEKNDIASGTSWTSSKLIHGGLRYLEYYEFKLVREALKEREVLFNKAPHIIQPLTFVLPHDKHLRPKWLIRTGLFLYDHLSKLKSLKKSKRINLHKTLEGKSLKKKYKTGFTYSDCRVDDARLVVLNAKTAQQHGAEILTRTKCVHAARQDNNWRAVLKSNSGEEIEVFAKGIVNAAGPWVSDIIHNIVETQAKSQVKWVKGSHFVIPKLYEGNHAYILQNKDKRIVFAIPYEFEGDNNNELTLIGTTDLDYKGDLNQINMDDSEADYLCELINEYFEKQTSKDEILWSYAGVRPLYDDQSENASKTTREYHFELEDDDGQLPLLSVFGGKITTYRKLSEHALQKLKPYFHEMKKAWTADSYLPGGDIVSLNKCCDDIKSQYPFLSDKQAYRYARSYGSKTMELLKGVMSLNDLGRHFGATLYEKELEYLMDHEWMDDLFGAMWLRSKLGLHLTEEERQGVDSWIKDRFA